LPLKLEVVAYGYCVAESPGEGGKGVEWGRWNSLLKLSCSWHSSQYASHKFVAEERKQFVVSAVRFQRCG